MFGGNGAEARVSEKALRKGKFPSVRPSSQGRHEAQGCRRHAKQQGPRRGLRGSSHQDPAPVALRRRAVYDANASEDSPVGDIHPTSGLAVPLGCASEAAARCRSGARAVVPRWRAPVWTPSWTQTRPPCPRTPARRCRPLQSRPQHSPRSRCGGWQSPTPCGRRGRRRSGLP